MEKIEKKFLEIRSGNLSQEYRWHAGPYWSRFLTELRDNKRILGIRCSKCKRVYVPPRQVCGRCFAEMGDWVALPGTGTVDGFTVVKFPYIDPSTGVQKPVPYAAGFIRIDGADTCLLHFLDAADESRLEVGMRVEAVFRDKREGSIRDIEHFAARFT